MKKQFEKFAQRINAYLQREAQNTEGPGWPQWIPDTIQKNGWEEMEGADICRDGAHKITTNADMTQAYVVAVEDDTEEVIGQHTPAPWTTSYDGHGGMTVLGSDGQQVGFVSNNRWQKANAALIAAAPDMLEALKRITERIEWLGARGTPLHRMAQAAIAKAEGRVS